MAGKNIGYFVEEGGRHGFVGGIGGPEEIVPRKELYSRAVLILKKVDEARKPKLVGIERQEHLKERWVTMGKAMQKGLMKVKETWNTHRNWWTLRELERKLDILDEEEETITIEVSMEEENALLGEEGTEVRRKVQEFQTPNAEQAVGREEEVSTSEIENTEVLVPENGNGDEKSAENSQDRVDAPQNNPMEVETKITKGQEEDRKNKKGVGKKKSKNEGEMSEGSGKCQACGRIAEAHPKGRRKWIGCDRCGRWFIEECMFKMGEKIQRERYWQCQFCCEVAQKVEGIVGEWPYLKEQMKNIYTIMKEQKEQVEEYLSRSYEENIRHQEERNSAIKVTEKENMELQQQVEVLVRENEKLRQKLGDKCEHRSGYAKEYEEKCRKYEGLEKEFRDLKLKFEKIQKSEELVTEQNEEMQRNMDRMEEKYGCMATKRKEVEEAWEVDLKKWKKHEEKYQKTIRKQEGEIECYKEKEVRLEQEIQKYKNRDLESKNILKRKWLEIEKQVRNEFEKESDGEVIVRTDSNNNERTVRRVQIDSGAKVESQGKEDGEIEDKDDEWEWVEVTKKGVKAKGNRQWEHNYNKIAQERTSNSEIGAGAAKASTARNRDTEKRRLQDDLTPKSGGKKAKVNQAGEVNKVWFFGDSQVKWLTQDGGLVTSAFLNQWEVRMKRGAKYGEVLKIVDYNVEEMKQGDVIVILGGTNNIEDLGRMQGNTLKYWIEEEKKCTEKILNRVVKRGVKVISMVTPPKRIGSSKGTLEMQKLVKEIAEKTGTDFMSVYAPNETRGEFIQVGLMEDGVHITEERMRLILQKLKDRTGIEMEIKDSVERVDRMGMWPDKCWTCGALRRECMKEGHRRMGQCGRCLKEGHHEDVCWFQYKMCHNCGRRGHGGENKKMCKWY